MNEIKDALLRLVKAGRDVKSLQETYLKVGLNDNPLFEVYGDICEAIYSIVGEHTEEFSQSATYICMTSPILTVERRAEMLLAEYRKHHPEAPEQPKPNTMPPDGMKKLFKQNGGYMTPEGDWT